MNNTWEEVYCLLCAPMLTRGIHCWTLGWGGQISIIYPPASFLAPRSCRMQIFKRHFSSSVNEWSNHCWPKWCTQLKLRDIILTLTLKCESRNLAECQTWWHLYHPLVCISTFSKLPRDKKEISTLNSKDKIWWKGYWLVKNHFSHRCNRYIYSHILSFSWQIVFHCKKQEDKCAKIYSAITQLELQKIHRFSQSPRRPQLDTIKTLCMLNRCLNMVSRCDRWAQTLGWLK